MPVMKIKFKRENLLGYSTIVESSSLSAVVYCIIAYITRAQTEKVEQRIFGSLTCGNTCEGLHIYGFMDHTTNAQTDAMLNYYIISS